MGPMLGMAPMPFFSVKAFRGRMPLPGTSADTYAGPGISLNCTFIVFPFSPARTARGVSDPAAGMQGSSTSAKPPSKLSLDWIAVLYVSDQEGAQH